MARTGHNAPRSRLPAILGCAGFIVLLGFEVVLTAGTSTAGTAPSAPPDVWTFPSHVGEIRFPHSMHTDMFGMDCTECHHPVKAAKLETPHPEYFEGAVVECHSCHAEKPAGAGAMSCAACHPRNGNVLEDRSSARVVLHQTCGECHEIGTGQSASESCSFCHSGPKKPW